MGRRKLKIQRLEDMKARQAIYSMRKRGILKKAKELSILCDVEVVLSLSSPSGKPTLFVGQDPKRAYTMEVGYTRLDSSRSFGSYPDSSQALHSLQIASSVPSSTLASSVVICVGEATCSGPV
ncbi:MADS-box transcription factor 50-like [Gossypium raimondii]|uniref:MADS-box transcription factor 50-like n=1 Tax=Gossypium raimondii TaxID=29730 RepID=UPI00227BE478|nr:MADS-box transcription factor 50-like [Gossypium raimondii]